jgi:hypothetical protein
MVFIISLIKYCCRNRNYFDIKKERAPTVLLRPVLFDKLYRCHDGFKPSDAYKVLHIKPEVHHITILHYIFFSFNS